MMPPYFQYAPHFTAENTQQFTSIGTNSSQPMSDHSPQTPISTGSQYPQFSTQINLEEEAENENEGNEGRRKKWEQNDDKFLIHAWLRVSKDPIVGNDQPLQTFWKRVHESFEEGQAFEKEKSIQKRTWQQCKSRWSKISKDVMKFGGCYDQIKRRSQSGKNEYDYLKDAHDLFKQNEGKPCMVEHCWVILHNEPKWRSQFGNAEKSQGKRTKVSSSKAYTSSSSNNDISINDDVSEPLIRLPGRAAIKRKGKEKAIKGKEAKEVFEKLEELNSADSERIEIVRKFNEICEQKERRKQLEWERSIMFADISSMDEVQRHWIEDMRKEIMKKRSDH